MLDPRSIALSIFSRTSSVANNPQAQNRINVIQNGGSSAPGIVGFGYLCCGSRPQAKHCIFKGRRLGLAQASPFIF